MTPTDLATRIDHTLLKPEANATDIAQLIAEAKQHSFASVCVAPIWVATAAKALIGTPVQICTVTSFPHGTSKSTLKAIEAVSSVKDGATEIDVVAHLPYLASQNLDLARAELLEVVRACRAARREVRVKVIVESAYLLSLGVEEGEAAIACACRAVRESGCDFIKTSTGFHPSGGASLEAIRMMKKYGDGLLIKASGGIRDLATATAMLDAGADRLGLSASVAILNQLKSARTDPEPA